MVERRPLTATDKPMVSTNGSGEITANSPLCDRLAEIERRVSMALSSDMTSSALAKLCQQLGFAVIAADEFAKSEAEKALDPTQYPDPVAARTAAESSAFMVNRLRTMTPRLAAHFQKVYAAEKVQTHVAKLRALAPEHELLQRELRETFQQATAKLVDLFQRIRDFERRVSQQLGNPPPGVDVLPPLDGVRLLDRCTLPDWSNPDINIWPPRPRISRPRSPLRWCRSVQTRCGPIRPCRNAAAPKSLPSSSAWRCMPKPVKKSSWLARTKNSKPSSRRANINREDSLGVTAIPRCL